MGERGTGNASFRPEEREERPHCRAASCLSQSSVPPGSHRKDKWGRGGVGPGRRQMVKALECRRPGASRSAWTEPQGGAAQAADRCTVTQQSLGPHFLTMSSRTCLHQGQTMEQRAGSRPGHLNPVAAAKAGHQAMASDFPETWLSSLGPAGSGRRRAWAAVAHHGQAGPRAGLHPQGH